MKKGVFTYENGLVGLMALTFGCLFFDRLSLNFLMPFVARDLRLTDTQIGLLAGGLSLAWAVSGFFTTAWAEATDRKKAVFVAAVLLFSLCSVGSGWAVSFGTLLLTRFVMGLSEGVVIPLAQNFVERESSPHRLGLNAGVLQAVGSALFGSILAPVLLVAIAQTMGWRNAFLLAGLPGLGLGLLAWGFVKKRTATSLGGEQRSAGSVGELLRYGNIRWGIGLMCCVLGWWFATLPFITNYFVAVQGMTPQRMGQTMGLLGLSGLIGSALVPALSDRLGRKPTLFVFLGLGVFYPLTVWLLPHSPAQMPLMFITYLPMGCIAIAGAVIPSEAVPAPLKARAMGLLVGVGEIVGGVLVPALSGLLSDVLNASAFLWVSSGMALLGLFFVGKLRETAPVKAKPNQPTLPVTA
jgi:MFS family permease